MEESTCPRCQRRVLSSKLVAVPIGGLCASCAKAGETPAYLQRHGEWSPLALGSLSIVFDPLFIVTFKTLGRAMRDLRSIKQAEANGLWSPAHAQARSGALWGIMFALGRWALIGIGIAAALLVISLEDREPRRVLDVGYEPSRNELEELVAYYRDGEPPDLIRQQLQSALSEDWRPDFDLAVGQLADASPALEEDLLEGMITHCRVHSRHCPRFGRLLKDHYAQLERRELAMELMETDGYPDGLRWALCTEVNLAEPDEAVVLRGGVRIYPDMISAGQDTVGANDLTRIRAKCGELQ